jgi:hypothetical protein
MELRIIPLSLYKQPASLGEICMQCLQSDWTKTQLCQPKKINKKKKEKRDQDKKKPTQTQNQESINDYLSCLFYNLGLKRV